MKKRIFSVLLTLVMLLTLGLVTAAPVGAVGEGGDLSGGPYSYDIPAGAGDITTISFDYSYGAAPKGADAEWYLGDFRIGGPGPDQSGNPSWLSEFRIGTASFNMDTDFGPYEVVGSELLAGEHHYEFTLNESNGRWNLTLDGALVNFIAHANISGQQADGTAIPAGSPTPEPYFSDETDQAYANAQALGWWIEDWDGVTRSLYYSATRDGVGGIGVYELIFAQATGGYVANIVVTYSSDDTVTTTANIPEIVGISVTPTSIDFGTVMPGDTVAESDISVENVGTVTVNVDAELYPLSGTVFDYLKLGGVLPTAGKWDGIIANLQPSITEPKATVLEVPLTYSAKGPETATIIFWAEEAIP